MGTFRVVDTVHIHLHEGGKSRTLATIETVRDAPTPVKPNAKPAGLAKPVEVSDDLLNPLGQADVGGGTAGTLANHPHHRLTDSAPRRMRATAPGGAIPTGRIREERAGIRASGPHQCGCNECRGSGRS